MHGFESVVGPVKGVFDKETSLNKAREHSLLRSDRPAYVTILSLGAVAFLVGPAVLALCPLPPSPTRGRALRVRRSCRKLWSVERGLLPPEVYPELVFLS